ncbi:MAG: YceD family protein [Phocaeicola sp.]
MKAESSQYDLQLDNQFFVDLDAPEVQKGKLTVSLEVKKAHGVFTLYFQIDGTVKVPCDRCLDDMEISVSVSEELKVKLGHEFSEEGDIVIVPEEDGYINVAWFIYEFITLSVPMKHVHAPGKCNKGMVGKLGKHLRTVVDGEEMEDDDDDFLSSVESDTESFNDESKEIDPRWNELKKIIDNN